MANKIQIRRDISVFWSNVNPILSQGEPGFETDTGRFKIGNGITSWNVLPYLTSNLEIITANLQNQIDYVKSNLNSAALDSLSEIVTAFQAFDANVLANVSTIQTLVANLEINAGVQHTAISVLESNASVQQANISLLLNQQDRLVNGTGNLILDAGGNITVQNMINFSSGALVDSSNNNIEIRGIDNFNIESRNVVNIYTNTQGNVYQWQFDDNGNLTLPQTAMNVSPAPTSLPGITWTDGTLQTTAFTGSSAKVDIVNTNGLSTTYYPTFVESRTTDQYVRADVDLTYHTDSNLLRSGNIQVGHNIYGSYRSGLSNAIQFRPNIDIDKRFLFTVDSSGGTYLRSGMEMPGAEVDKAVTLAFPHANNNAGFIYIQGLDSGATDFNDAFNIMMNSGNVKISALSYANGNKVWTFDTTGNLTLPQTQMNVSPAPTSLPGIRFTDGSLQTKAFTGTEFPTNIVNTHGGSAVIYVGGTEASSESLYVRVANVSSTLGVEVKYSHAVTSSISAFREYPNPTNIYSGLYTKSGSNNDYDNFGNLVTVGDTMSVSISDHSNHKIYRVSVTARSMPGVSVAGDAYCVIEKLK